MTAIIGQTWWCSVHHSLMAPGMHRCPTGSALRILDCEPHYLTPGPKVRDENGS